MVIIQKMNLNDKIPECPDFCWGEFIGYSPLREQTFLIANLAKLLQAVRGVFRVRFHITSGVRDILDVKRLEEQGYAVGRCSDHSYLDSDVYQFGVGAADFTVDDKGLLKEIFDYYVVQGRDGKLRFGQVIYYPLVGGDSRSQGLIHLSNPRNLVFSPSFCRVLPPKRKYLVYVAEDKAYKAYE